MKRQMRTKEQVETLFKGVHDCIPYGNFYIESKVVMDGLSSVVTDSLLPKLTTFFTRYFSGSDCMVITSAREGVHSVGSYHYLGLAIDLRTKHITCSYVEVVVLRNRLQTFLGDRWKVIAHTTHIHIQYTGYSIPSGR